MFKKILKSLILCLVLIFTLASCDKLGTTKISKEEAYENAHEKYMSLEAYRAKAYVTYIANGKEVKFLTNQISNMNGQYRIELIEPENVAGSTTISDGKAIYQFNERVSKDVYISNTESLERIEILLTSFMKNYKQSDNVSVVSNLDESLYTMLEAKIGGDHPLISLEKLWINNETLEPEKLVIYDKNNIETIRIEYIEFEFNPTLDQNLFQVNVK